MDRRGFFSRLLGRTPEEGDAVFFGLQLVVNVGSDDTLRANLHRVVNRPVATERPAEKRAFYKRVTAVLLEAEPFFDYAYWDYRTDPASARPEFESWLNEIEGSIATEEEELGEAVDEQFRMSGDRSYVVVSILFLLENVTALRAFRSVVEAVPEDEAFSRTTFPKLLRAITYVDFEYALGDAVFIMPGNERDGISWEEIHTEGWNYLKPIA